MLCISVSKNITIIIITNCFNETNQVHLYAANIIIIAELWFFIILCCQQDNNGKCPFVHLETVWQYIS